MDIDQALANEICTGCGRGCTLAEPMCSLGREMARDYRRELTGEDPEDDANNEEGSWRRSLEDGDEMHQHHGEHRHHDRNEHHDGHMHHGHHGHHRHHGHNGHHGHHVSGDVHF